ncbi:MFS transporter [Bacillus testis]|uniref:MFS transporter n=1 Tax=Bacillus testis TaxID=1622072 RepID=UPI00067E9DB4|nr:MFS transporter [Bacillus testis]
MSQTKEKLWTKDFVFMAVINFILMVIFYLLMVTMASYAVKEYHSSVSQAGLVTGIYIVGTLIGRIFTGRIIHKVGTKKILMIGLILFPITMAFYFIQAGIAVLIISRLVNGIAVGIASTATSTVVAQILPNSRKGEGIGYFSMSTTLGTAIGPFFGLMLSQHTTYFVIFMLCMLLAIIALISSLFAKIPANDPYTTAPEEKGFRISQYIDKKALPIAIIMLLFSLGYASVLSYLNFFAEERDLVSTSSFFFFVYALSILFTRPFTGPLMDTKGANYVVYPCAIFFGAGLILLSFSHSPFVLLLSGVIIGIGYGNISSVLQALAIKVTTPEKMGLATSTYFIGLDVGLGFGPYLLGYLVPSLGYSHLYVWLGIFMFFLMILYLFLHGKKDHLLSNNQ